MNLIATHPEYFFLLIPLIFGIYYTHFWTGRGGRLKLPVSIWGSEKFRPRQGGYSFLVFLTSLFFWASILLIIIALSGPERVDKEKVYLKQGKDIIIVLDESPSMFARDLGVSRFDASRQQLINFINLRENDAIGLVTYSSEAVLRVPPTTDYSMLKYEIETLTARDDQLGEGTDIGMAIAFGCYHLSNCSSDDQVIILLTDGVNNSGSILPLEAADQARKMGIRIYPIGIGSRSDSSTLLVEDVSGKLTHGEIEGRRDDSLLQKLAKATGGTYDSSATVSVLAEVLESISSMEPSNAEGRIDRHTVPLVHPVVIAAMILLLLHFFIRKQILKEVL